MIMEMTDDVFVAASRSVSLTVLEVCDALGLGSTDQADLAGAALVEILCQILGPFAAVERLRDIADRMEVQLIPTNSVQ
ncbi:hypothetical protein [Novosphingobium mathurense]|uniref:Uncharacterized protein n=1 Tax=Novosphingobium mathurense TaxID=428990 RepID=A0A1U6HAS1_9SPHN|nr:hypothetical protein [Novosphingobium mathurense]SLJ92874.1 hypothetical protein SAMN06295987_1025 [Novosphingobium mathurense]